MVGCNQNVKVNRVPLNLSNKSSYDEQVAKTEIEREKGGITLAENGICNYTIVYEKNPTSELMLAVEFLQSSLTKIIDLTKYVTKPGEYLLDFGNKNPFKVIDCIGYMDGYPCDNSCVYLGNGQFSVRRTAITTEETTVKVEIKCKPKLFKSGRITLTYKG